MRGLVLLVSLAAVSQAAADYLPLATGNQWVYQVRGQIASEPVVVEVGKETEIGGVRYFAFKGIQESLQLRSADGIVYANDSGIEGIYRDFTKAVGESFSPKPDPCNQVATVVSRDAAYKGPIGEFGGSALEIRYTPGNCADAGITSEIYLPYVGLVRRTVITFAGPVTYDLVYARLGVAVITAQEASFSIALDANSYPRGWDSTRVRLALRNTQSTPIRLDFKSAQEFDFTISNEQGTVIYTWSANKRFAEVLHSLEITGEKNWSSTAPVAILEPGKYVVEAWLTTTDGAKKYKASTAFEIK